MAASNELLELLAKREAVQTEETALLSVLEFAATYTLASGEMAPTDPEFKAMMAQGETMGLSLLHRAQASMEKFLHKAHEHAAKPGEEIMVTALRRQAASAMALKTRAEEFMGFIRKMTALSDDSPAPPVTARPRRLNAKYFGLQWIN